MARAKHSSNDRPTDVQTTHWRKTFGGGIIPLSRARRSYLGNGRNHRARGPDAPAIKCYRPHFLNVLTAWAVYYLNMSFPPKQPDNAKRAIGSFRVFHLSWSRLVVGLYVGFVLGALFRPRLSEMLTQMPSGWRLFVGPVAITGPPILILAGDLVWWAVSRIRGKVPGFKRATAFTYPHTLDLSGTLVTDTALEKIISETPKITSELQTLNLAFTKVTDAAMRYPVQALKGLQFLDLTSTSVTDTGLEYLKDLKELQSLRLSRTQVTDAGLATLHTALPDCSIR